MTHEEKIDLASSPNTPKEALEELSKDKDGDVRYWVARNPNTPKEALIKLSKDEYWSVRYWVARNPNATYETLLILSDSKEKDIIKSLLQRQDLDPLIRLKLTKI